MPWDDDAVLRREALAWRFDPPPPAVNAVALEFWRQLAALTLKNFLLLFRLGRWFVLALVVPVVVTLMVGAAYYAANPVPGIVVTPEPIVELGYGGASVQCEVFEPHKGGPQRGAWCSPMLYAPSANKEVVELMRDVASRNGWRVQQIASGAEARGREMPEACSDRKCVLGFQTADDLGDWLGANSGRAATAVVFVERELAANGTFQLLGGERLPDDITLEIWHNASAEVDYRRVGLNVLMIADNETGSLPVLGAQHAVEEAIVAKRLGSSRARSRVRFRRYPRLESLNSYFDLIGQQGVGFALLAVGPLVMLLLGQLVSEREVGLVSLMRQLGLQEGAWWLSFAVQQAVIAFVVSLLTVATGNALRVPFWFNTHPLVHMANTWLYIMAASGMTCALSTRLQRSSQASALSVGFYCLNPILGALLATSPDFQALYEDPSLTGSPLGVRAALFVCYPLFGFAKAFSDVNEATRPNAEVDEASGLVQYVARSTYLLDDLTRGGYGGENLVADRAAAAARGLGPTWSRSPTAEAYGWLALSAWLWFTLAWWAAQVFDSRHGARMHPLFFLSPSFWRPSERGRGNVELLARLRAHADPRDLDELDVDVAAEALAVLGGNLSAEKKVGVYAVHKRFGDEHAVRGLSFSMQHGEIFALLGHNGAGKSTTIGMLTGRLEPSAGDVLVYGASVVNDVYAVRKMIGLCPQFDALLDSLTAEQHLCLFGQLKGLSRSQSGEAAPAALEAVRLLDARSRLVRGFSGGMKRRLSVAIAYTGDPRMVVLDEPTTGMDPYNRKFVWDMMASARRGRTTLLSTHAMEEAEALGNTIGILSQGQLIALGSVVHLKQRFGSGYTIRLVASSGDQLGALQARVRSMLPSAELVDDAAGSCTYAVTEAEMKRAAPLLRYIEELKRKSDANERTPDGVELKDWLVTHTTLEEVFIRLAHRQRARGASAVGGRDAPPHEGKLGAGAHDGEGSTAASDRLDDSLEASADGVDPAHVALDFARETEAGGSELVHGHPLRASWRKSVVLYRRQPWRMVLNCCVPLLLLATLQLLQVVFIDEPSVVLYRREQELEGHIAIACVDVVDAFDGACERGHSLRGGAESEYSACGACAQPRYAGYYKCCVLGDAWSAECVRDQCTGLGPDALPPDFRADCNASALERPRPYCECTDEGEERSAALDARIAQTPACRAYRAHVLRTLGSGFIEWVPSAHEPGALDRALAAAPQDDGQEVWLGWRIPVFADEELGLGELRAEGSRRRPYLATLDAPAWGERVTFPADEAGMARRARELGLSGSQLDAARALAARVRMDGLLAHFPTALARTTFNVSKGEPSAPCSVPRASAKCCFDVTVGNAWRPFRLDAGNDTVSAVLLNFNPPYFDRELSVCSALGGRCPARPGSAEELFTDVLGLSRAEADDLLLVRGAEIARDPSQTIRVGVGREADFEGRPTACTASGEPPICEAIRARDANASALSCEQIRRDPASWRALARAAEPAWRAAEFDDDASWECVEAECVQYEYFATPAYTAAGWADQRELNEHVLREQVRVQANAYAGRADAEPAGAGHATRLNLAEQLFPSWSVEVHALDVAEGQVEWTLTSFFRELDWGSYLYASEPLGAVQGSAGLEAPSDGATGFDIERWLRRFALGRPFKLQRAEPLVRLVPHMLHNAFTNAILAEALGDGTSVVVGSRAFPELSAGAVHNASYYVVEASTTALLPLASVLLLPQIATNLVSDKEQRVYVLMQMMGLDSVSYWVVQWLAASAYAHTWSYILVGIGAAFGLNSIQRSAGALFLVLTVWSQLKVWLAFLASCFFQRTRIATFLISLYLTLGLVFGVTVYLLHAAGSTEWSLLYDLLYPPFAFFHCLWLAVFRRVAASDLFRAGTEIRAPFFIMLIHIGWIVPLTFYLDAVLPREFGVPAHPLFCLRWLRGAAEARAGRGREEARGAAHAAVQSCAALLTREHAPEPEDADVRAERLVLESGAHRDAPIQVFSLRKVFAGGRVAISNLAFKIETNECFGLLGPNGAGKSTAIAILTSVYPPTSGTAVVGGFDVRSKQLDINRVMGVCPQFDVLWPDLTVGDHILFYSRLKGVPRRSEQAVTRRVAESVSLLPKLDHRVSRLSGGQRRRVSLAIALIGRPPVVFLDEPTTGLDPETRRLMWRLIEDSKPGRTIVLTSHSMDEVDALCTRIGIMANGEMRALGTTVHLKNTLGEGYQIDVSLMPSQEERVHAFVTSALPTAELLSVFAGVRTYKVHRRDVSLATIFQRMERRPAQLGILDWGLRQASLEEVFLRIAAEAEASGAHAHEGSATRSLLARVRGANLKVASWVKATSSRRAALPSSTSAAASSQPEAIAPTGPSRRSY